jgi:diacylglycerol kinase family enzyme
MDRRGLRHDFLATRSDGRTVADVAKALAGGSYRGVVAMGGDGTFNEVAKGLLRSQRGLPMGMIPTGTANDQGRSFGMESSQKAIARNVAVLAEGHTTPLDAGRIVAYDYMDHELGEDWFFDSCGWGVSALILRMRNEDRRLVGGLPILRDVYRDQLVYAGAIMRAFLKGFLDDQFFEAEVRTEVGQVFYERLTDLVVKNTKFYAGAWILDPTALPDDGQMELVPFAGREEWIGRAIVHHELMPISPEDVTQVGMLRPIVRAPAFDILLHDRPGGTAIEGQLDGEEWIRAHRYHVDVVRHAIQLVVPAG